MKANHSKKFWEHFFKTGLEETFKHYDETGSNEDCPRKVRARVPSAAEEKFNRVTSTSDWQYLGLEPCEGPRRAGSLFSVIGAVPDHMLGWSRSFDLLAQLPVCCEVIPWLVSAFFFTWEDEHETQAFSVSFSLSLQLWHSASSFFHYFFSFLFAPHTFCIHMALNRQCEIYSLN